jgi:hypothetical protein
MPKNQKPDVGTEATFRNRGEEFATKKEADNYGIIYAQVEAFNGDEDFIASAMAAYREGCFSLPKKAKATEEDDE